MFQILADQTTSILDKDLGIEGLLGLVVKILSYGLGAAAVIGVVVAGIMYLMARDNESQVAAAKQRLLNTVIGLIAWVVMFSVVSWLIPGGVPDPSNPGSDLPSNDRQDENPIDGGGTIKYGDEDKDEDDWGDLTCSEKRQKLKDQGMSTSEINAALRDEGC